MHAYPISQDTIARLAGAISEACDGHDVITILAAISDIIAGITAQAGVDATLDEVLSDFVGIVHQRHGHGVAN